MSKKTFIWFIGSNGCGKTTQNRMLLDTLSCKQEPYPVEGEEGKLNYFYTVYGNSQIATLGKMGKNQCTGIDSVYGKLGADGVAMSLQKAVEDKKVSLITAECVFGTMSWYNKWVKSGLRDRINLLVIHLDFSHMMYNFERIKRRRAVKQERDDWYNVLLEDTVYKNVGAKYRETRTIYNKLAGTYKEEQPKLADDCIQIDGMQKPELIHEQITNFIMSNI